MDISEYRSGCEFRVSEDGRTLTGTVLRYGDEALVSVRGRVMRERFEARAFEPIPDVPLVVQHDESLVIAKGGDYALNDGPRELTLRAELRADSAALKLVKAGALAGYSLKFFPIEERMEHGVRIIARAKLAHVGLVDAGAYPGSLAEVRNAPPRRRWWT